ncbi:alcohol dehydrogenase catalytic domain-containing protein [Streptomyces sp. NPDC052302]|uniref:alcohol dehydrogenase catalytic domain-containing protein n=1 Tax=Streptomyces sp. NPDC052302 TaxID=3365688 RepID=UPI0037D5781F
MTWSTPTPLSPCRWKRAAAESRILCSVFVLRTRVAMQDRLVVLIYAPANASPPLQRRTSLFDWSGVHTDAGVIARDGCRDACGGPGAVRRSARGAGDRRPTPGQGQVPVRIHAGGVNPLDTKIRARKAAHARVRSPTVLGMDLSGQVVQMGAAVSGFAPGDEVYGRRGRLAGIAGTVRGGRHAPAAPQTGQAADAEGGSAAVGRAHGMAPGGPGRRTGRAEGSRPRPGRRRGQCRVQIAAARGAELSATTSAATTPLVRRLQAVPIDYAPGASGQVRRRAHWRYPIRHRLRHRGRPGPGLLLRGGAHLHRSCGRRAGLGNPRARAAVVRAAPTRASSHCCRI